ncbi:MAG: protein kinase [Sumerlaeia bacterium]
MDESQESQGWTFGPEDSADPQESFVFESNSGALLPRSEFCLPSDAEDLGSSTAPPQRQIDSTVPHANGGKQVIPTTPAGASPYRLLRRIGQGGYGEVWEAIQQPLERSIAVKIPQVREDRKGSSTDKAISVSTEWAFRHEALVTANLEHPNIVPVHDWGHDDQGRPLLAMKLVRGTPWPELIWEDESKTQEEMLTRHLSILISVAQAVAFAHSRGIVHRDLKPQQVMVGEYGEVLLMDWGLAVVYDLEKVREMAPRLLGAGAVMGLEDAPNPAGTPAFMAPEQTEATAQKIGPWTDVYLLGGILYYILSGRTPHPGRKADEAFTAAVSYGKGKAQIRPLDAQKVPAELIRLTMDALHPDPEHRVASAEAFIARLREYLSGAGRRTESLAISTQVDEELLASQRADYRELGDARAQLDRALQLWPGNEKARALHAHTVLKHVHRALALGDLGLAESLVPLIPDTVQRRDVESDIGNKRRQVIRDKWQRRGLLTASLFLVLLMAAFGVAYYNTRARRAEELAAVSAQRAAEAQRAQYASDLLYAQGLADRGDKAEAEQLLINLPQDRRDLAWQMLLGEIHPELLTLPAHTGAVMKLDFTADGRQLLTASADNALRVWNMEDASLRIEIDGGSDRLRTAAISPSGRFLATAEIGGPMKLWNAQDGTMLGEWPWDAGFLQFDPTETLLAAGGTNQLVRVMELSSLRTLAIFDQHGGEVRTTRFSPDGQLMVSSSYDSRAIVWSMSALEPLHIFDYHVGGLEDAVFSPIGDRVLTVSHDAQGRLWNVREGTNPVLLKGHTGSLTQGLFSPDSRTVATASNDGTARLWDSTTGVELAKIETDGSEISQVLFSPNGEMVLTVSLAGLAEAWSTRTASPVAVLSRSAAPLCRPVFSPQGALLALAEKDNRIHIYRGTMRRDDWRLALPSARIMAAATPANGQYVAAGAADGSVSISRRQKDDAAPFGPPRIIGKHDREVSALAPHPTKPWLVSGGYDGVAKLWDIREEEALRTITGHTREVTAAAFSPDGASLATASFDGSVRVSSLMADEDQKVLPCGSHPVLAVEFSPDGQFLAAGDAAGVVYLWDWQAGATPRRIQDHAEAVTCLSFSPGGEHLASGSRDERVRLWDISQGMEKARGSHWLLGHDGPVTDTTFSPDGKLLASTGEDNIVCLWDVASGRQLVRQRAVGYRPREFHFAAERYDYFTLDEDGSLRFFSPPPAQWDIGTDLSLWKDTFADWQKREYGHYAATYRSEPLDFTPAALAGGPPRQAPSPFADYLADARGPLPLSAQELIEIGTPMQILTFIRYQQGNKKLFIAGDTPELGDWTPCKVAFIHLEETPYGHVWKLDTVFKPVRFKLLYGEEGDGWAAGEWWGMDNRVIPSEGARMYRKADGTVILLCEYGKKPRAN